MIYLLFTLEPLHNLYLGISKVLKVWSVIYLSSDRLIGGVPVNGRKPFWKSEHRFFIGEVY